MDQTQDLNGQKFYKITRMYPPPAFVKSANDLDIYGDNKVRRDLYADRFRKLYPCHTKAATWTSAAFMFDNKNQVADLDTVRDQLYKFAEYHGITDLIKDLEARTNNNQPKSEDNLPDEAFAFVQKTANGTVRRYPIRNLQEIFKAASYLVSNQDSLPFVVKNAIAEKILNCCDKFGARFSPEIQEVLEKTAGYGRCTARECANIIVDRVRLAKDMPNSNFATNVEMLKMANMIIEKPWQVRDREAMIKLAETIDLFDRINNLDRLGYSKLFPRVEDAFFGLTHTKISRFSQNHVNTIIGTIYNLSDLSRVKVGEIRDVFGDDIAESLTDDGMYVDGTKAAAVLPTLPRGDAEMFDHLMVDLGIVPMGKEASQVTQKLSNSYLLQLAKLHQPVHG